MKYNDMHEAFAPVLSWLIQNFHPIIAFFVFVLLYFVFVFFFYGNKEVLIKEIKAMSWARRTSLLLKIFLGIYIAYFLFYRLMIMTSMLGYPLPGIIQIFGESVIKFLETVGSLR